MQSIELSFDSETGAIEVSGSLTEETSGDPGEIVYLPAIITDEYPITLGEFNDFIDIPSAPEVSSTFDFEPSNGGWNSNIGSWSDGTGWEPGCIGGAEEKLDIYYEFGSSVSISEMSCTYDATYAGGADNLDQFLVRISGGTWLELKQFTTQTGTGLTESVVLSTPVVVDAIRLIMYAGGTDCTGSLTLKSFMYSGINIWTHEFNFKNGDGSWALTGLQSSGCNLYGSYSAGVGWIVQKHGADEWYYAIIESQLIPSTVITGIVVTYYTSNGVYNTAEIINGVGCPTPNPYSLLTRALNAPVVGIKTLSWSGRENIIQLYVLIRNGDLGSPGDTNAYIQAVIVQGEGRDPF